MIAHTSAVRPTVESAKPGTSSGGAAGSLDSGTRKRPASSAPTTIGRLTRKTQLQSACSTSQPPLTGPIAMPMPATPAQIPIALRGSAAREDVGQDRQRRGHDERAADAHQRPGGDQHVGGGGDGGQGRAGAEHQQAEGQRPAAAEAVAERAGGEQQAGEDEHVGVDDPLQRGGGGGEIALERRQRDVEDRVVEADHDQRDAEDGERPPAARIRARRRSCGGAPVRVSKRDGIVSALRRDRTAPRRNASVSFRIEVLAAPSGASAAARRVHDLEVAARDATQRAQLVVVPPGVRRAGDEPVRAVVGHDQAVASAAPAATTRAWRGRPETSTPALSRSRSPIRGSDGSSLSEAKWRAGYT